MLGLGALLLGLSTASVNININITIDVSAVQSRSSRQLHGVTIDTFSLSRLLNFSDPALLRPAAALAPALLRVGGSAQRGYPVCFSVDHSESANTSCLTRQYWASLCAFASAINTSLVFGLHNDVVENMPLIASVLKNRSACPALAGFSIGNEGVPGSNETFHGIASALRAQSPPSGFPPLKLVGPESPMMSSNSDYFVPLATKLIDQYGDVLSAATFHFYAFNARDLSVGRRGISPATLTIGNLSHLFTKSSLDQIVGSIEQFQAVLANTSHPNLPIWLSETNSICSGGVAQLSNTYANTPWLLNQLGRVASAGIPVMAHQTLIGEDYGLISGAGDRTQAGEGWMKNLSARPNVSQEKLPLSPLPPPPLCIEQRESCSDLLTNVLPLQQLFVMALHQRLVSGATLRVSGNEHSSDTAGFAYCTAPSALQPRGAVTVVLVNFRTDGRDFQIGSAGDLGGALVYSLLGEPEARVSATPSPQDILQLIESPVIFLNGADQALSVADLEADPSGQRQSLRPRVVERAEGSQAVNVSLPPLGVAFVVLPNASAPACARLGT